MRFDWQPTVYLLTSRLRGSFYIGVTSNLEARLHEHRAGKVIHTQRYQLNKLVWFEDHKRMDEAILREKRLKRWRREWKIEMVEAANPGWQDLAVELGLPPVR